MGEAGRSGREDTVAVKRTAGPVALERGEEIEGVMFRGSRRGLSRRDLHVALEPTLRAWLRALCRWDDPTIGDFKFLILSLEVAPETEVFVQFWSEPFEQVIWEVSSGRWNPPADEWLAGERAAAIEEMGFAIGGKAENYRRVVQMRTPADIAAVAKAVVEIFYRGFDYRGRRPIHARLVHDGRSETRPTYTAFTPEDVGKLFLGLGFTVEEPADALPEKLPGRLRCSKGRMKTIVEFDDRVGDQNLFKVVRLSADIALPAAERKRLEAARGAPDGEPYATVSAVLPFGGGVTLAWLIERIQEWDRMLAGQRRVTRRRRTPRPAPVTDTVH